jgi:glycosyltransferase involved in cell wall biosynthesis
LLEAMKSGAPIVASDIPAMREMGGEAPSYFDPRSERDIARALEELLNDRPRRELLGARGAERAKLYSWEQFTGRLVQLYQDLYAERAAVAADTHEGAGDVR